MGKAYLKYEQIAGFGVVASTNVPVKQIYCPSPSSTSTSTSSPFIATAAVDILTVWNMRTGESVIRFGNSSTRKAGAISSIAVSSSTYSSLKNATSKEIKVNNKNIMIACGYTDGSIRVWRFNLNEISSYNEVFSEHPDDEPQPYITFNGHRSGISSLIFENSTDGIPVHLVSGSNDGDIILWSILEGNGMFRLNAHVDAVTNVLIFNSYIISSSKDSLVKIFDIDNQHCIQTITDSHSEIWGLQLQFQPNSDNVLLFIGSVGSEIYLYSLMDKNERNEFQKSFNNKNNDELFLKGFDERENIFKKLGHVERSSAMDRISCIESGLVNGERYILVCAVDKTAEIFRIRTQEQAEIHRKRREKRKLANIEKEVRGIAQDEGWLDEEDGKKAERIIEGRREKEAKFNIEAIDYMVSVRQLRMKKKLKSISFLLLSTYIPVDGRKKNTGVDLQLVVQHKDNALEIHSVVIGGGKKKKNKKKKKKVSEDEIEEEEDDEDETLKVDEIKKLITLDFPGHRNDVRSVSISPEENTLLSTSDGALKLWNIKSQKCIRTMKFSGYGLCTQFFGADGMIGAVGTKTGCIQIYELGSGSLIAQEEDAHADKEIWSMCLDNHIYDAKTLVTGGADKRVCFWGFDNVLVGTGGELELTRVLEMPDQVLCIRVVYERERPLLLVSMMDSTIRSYFMDSLEPYLNFYGHRLPCMSVDVSSDGNVLATGSADKTIKIWGLDFGDCKRSLRAHGESVLSVKFQPKTHYLFSGSKDGSLKYWDVDKYEMICEIDGQRGECWDLCISGDGEIVGSVSHDRMIRVWRRSDEPLFLDEEKDKRMEELFESKLIDDDVLQARKNRKGIIGGDEDKKNMGFMYDEGKGEGSAPGKMSIDTLKGGEALLEALSICEEERNKEEGEGKNPIMLGMSAEIYLLKTLERIRSPDLEEALQIVPLDAAVALLEYFGKMLKPGNSNEKVVRLRIESIVKTGLTLIRMYHGQMGAGAIHRNVLNSFYENVLKRLEEIRSRFAVNRAGLHFWKLDLADRNDRPFRDARARAYNMEIERKDRADKSLGRKRKRNYEVTEGSNNDEEVDAEMAT